MKRRRTNPCSECEVFTQCQKQGHCRIQLTNAQKKKRRYNFKLIGRWKQSKGCVECGYKEHAAALHVDHIDPSTKTYPGGRAWHPNWSKKRIKEELAKCQILCANCHSVKTYKERRND